MKALLDLFRTVTQSFTFNVLGAIVLASGIALGIVEHGLEQFGKPALLGAFLFLFIGDAAEALKKRGTHDGR